MATSADQQQRISEFLQFVEEFSERVRESDEAVRAELAQLTDRAEEIRRQLKRIRQCYVLPDTVDPAAIEHALLDELDGIEQRLGQLQPQ